MQAGIREILIITTPKDQEQFKYLLGSGAQWGIQLEYKIQPKPDGLAKAFILAENFLSGSPSVMILGDNIFFGHGLQEILKTANKQINGATIFSYQVLDPKRYGIINFDENGKVKSIAEKPSTIIKICRHRTIFC